MRMKNFFCLIFSILLNTLSFSQILQKTEYFTKDDGLSNHVIQRMHKDANGFFWITTNRNIIKWNGKNFEKIDLSKVKLSNSDYFDFSSNMSVVANDQENFFLEKNSVLKKCKREFVVITNDNIFFKKIKFTQKIYLHYNKNLNIDTFLQQNLDKIHQFEILQASDTSFYLINYLNNKIHYFENFILKTTINRFWKNPLNTIVKGYLLSIDGSNGKCYIIKGGSIYKEQYLPLFKNYISNDIWGLNSFSEYNVLGLKNNIVKIAIGEKESVITTLITRINNYKTYTCFNYEESAEKLFIGTYMKGLEVYATPRINIKNNYENDENKVIYTLADIDNKIITNQDIYFKIYKAKNPKWSWSFTGTICPLKNNTILTAGQHNLLLLDNKLNLLREFKTVNGQISDIITNDTCAYFINYTLNSYNFKKQTISEGLINNWPTNGEKIQAICNSYQPNILYAIIGEQLQELNLKTKETKIISPNIQGYIRSIFYDTSLKKILITTLNNGCYIVSNNPASSTTDLKRIYQNAHFFIRDKDGDYWLPSNNGLYFIFKKDLLESIKTNTPIRLSLKKFGENIGLSNPEFNGGFGGGYLLKGDSLYLASIAGTVALNTNLKKSNLVNTGKLVIDEVTINDSIVESKDKYILEADFKNIILKVNFPFTNSTEDFILYRLSGSNDSTWYNVSSDGIINFNNLMPGTYNLQIKCGNAADNFMHIELLVKPFWYNTWWAYTLFLLVILYSFYVLFMWRYRTLQNRNMKELQQSRTELFMTIAHDLKSPVNNYIGLADTISFLLKEKDFESISNIADEIDQKSRSLSLLLDNLLKWSFIEKNYFKPIFEPINIDEVINKLLLVYDDIAKHKQVNINVLNNGVNIITTDINLISTILRNIIDNAIKNAIPNSNISIEIKHNTEQCSIEVCNTTSNVNIKYLNAINQILQSTKKAEPHTLGMGLGMVLIQHCCKIINGSASISFNNNKACFQLIINTNYRTKKRISFD